MSFSDVDAFQSQFMGAHLPAKKTGSRWRVIVNDISPAISVIVNKGAGMLADFVIVGFGR